MPTDKPTVRFQDIGRSIGKIRGGLPKILEEQGMA